MHWPLRELQECEPSSRELAWGIESMMTIEVS